MIMKPRRALAGLFVLSAVTAMAQTHLVEGKADSPVRVLIYEDLQCPDCADFRVMLDQKLLPKYGAKVAFEAAGKAEAILQGLQSLRSGGRICLIGSTRSTVEITPLPILLKEASIVTSRARRLANWHRAIKLACARQINLEPFHSREVPLEGAVELIRKITEDRSIVHAAVNPWKKHK